MGRRDPAGCEGGGEGGREGEGVGPCKAKEEVEEVETLQTWTTSYPSPTASEVLGSIILTFRSTSELHCSSARSNAS